MNSFLASKYLTLTICFSKVYILTLGIGAFCYQMTKPVVASSLFEEQLCVVVWR